MNVLFILYIQLWKLLLSLDCDDSLKEGWRQTVHDIVQARVKEVTLFWILRNACCTSLLLLWIQVPKDLKVRLFCTLVSTGETDALLIKIFVDEAMVGLEHLMTKVSCTCTDMTWQHFCNYTSQMDTDILAAIRTFAIIGAIWPKN